MRGPRSLRGRLLVLVLALSGVVLLVSAVATYELTRRSLVDRLDTQLRAISAGASQGGPLALLVANRDEVLRRSRDLPEELQNDLRVGTADGGSIRWVLVGGSGGDDPTPLPTPVRDQLVRSPGEPASFDLDLADGGYRAVAQRTQLGMVLVVAQPLRDVDSTLSRLLFILAGVGGVMVAVAAVGALTLVRFALRPLDRIVVAADAIADGDLSHRVGTGGAPTEVAHVARAFDTMGDRIEAAFAEQRASEERVRRFAADASHELRTPLTSIRGYAELFRRGAAQRPDDLANAMARIEDESTRMSRIVESLLELARLDEPSETDFGPVPLDPLVEQMLAGLRAAHPEHTFTSTGDRGLVLHGDHGQIHSALTNLVANAGTHTPAGTTVTVHVARTPTAALIRVSDDGPGLPPGDPSHLFDRFTRGPGPAPRGGAAGGSGLGLAIVDAVARRHGGHVSALPSDRGACFELALPLAGTSHHTLEAGLPVTTPREG